MKNNELRQLSEQELRAKLLALSKQRYELKNECMLAKKLEKPHRLLAVKTEIARILTILRERELATK